MYAVIGDVIGSRRLADRGGAQRRIAEVLAEVDRAVPGAQPLQATVGDEFQGAYGTLGEATRSTLLVRLALLPEIDVRCGIGVGEVTVFDAERTPWLQDGPAWWAAREAIEWMTGSRRAGVRTWLVGPDATVANAHLLCRDALVDRLNERGWRMLRAALRGENQQRIAVQEGVTKSAVSQQFSRGISAVRDAQALLEREAVGRG
ncbi:MAG TPA: SatD family protein [Marmoricola sp.]|nr:SatD family protein [Marmoricola sp.]